MFKAAMCHCLVKVMPSVSSTSCLSENPWNVKTEASCEQGIISVTLLLMFGNGSAQTFYTADVLAWYSKQTGATNPAVTSGVEIIRKTRSRLERLVSEQTFEVNTQDFCIDSFFPYGFVSGI